MLWVDCFDRVSRIAVCAAGAQRRRVEDDGAMAVTLWAFKDVHAPPGLLICGFVGVHGSWIRCAKDERNDCRHGNALGARFGGRLDIIPRNVQMNR